MQKVSFQAANKELETVKRLHIELNKRYKKQHELLNIIKSQEYTIRSYAKLKQQIDLASSVRKPSLEKQAVHDLDIINKLEISFKEVKTQYDQELNILHNLLESVDYPFDKISASSNQTSDIPSALRENLSHELSANPSAKPPAKVSAKSPIKNAVPSQDSVSKSDTSSKSIPTLNNKQLQSIF